VIRSLVIDSTESIPNKTRRPRRRAGFSLIEVLVALTIFLLSLAALARLVDMGIDRQIDAQLKVQGSRLAQSKMAEVVSGSLNPGQSGISGGSGKFDDDSSWSWTMTAEQQTAFNLYLVTVTVTHENRGQPFNVVLAQMVYDPTQIGSAQAAAATTSQGSATPAPGSGATAPVSSSGGMP
jgi:general secretion pathway protein I